jgi:hypothetical protein
MANNDFDLDSKPHRISQENAALCDMARLAREAECALADVSAHACTVRAARFTYDAQYHHFAARLCTDTT